jgi:fatty-acyl-CoA synthase
MKTRQSSVSPDLVVRPSSIDSTVVSVTTVGDMLRRAASTWSHEALVTPKVRWLFADFDRRVDEFARAYIAHGVQPRDKVGVLLAQEGDYYAAVFGAMRIGAIAVPINARFKGRELGHVLRSSDMRILLVTAGVRGSTDFVALIHEVLPEMDSSASATLSLSSAPELRRVVVFEGQAGKGETDGDAFLAAGATVDIGLVHAASERVSVRDIGIIMYTSGTTSSPKGAMLSHEALTRAAAVVGSRQGLTIDDRVWNPLPMFHVGGMNFFLCSLAYGATHVHVGDFSPAGALAQIDAEDITVSLGSFDMMWMEVLRRPECDPTKWKRMRMVMIAVGAPERMREMQNKVPQAKLVSAFGATECSGFFSYGDVNDSVDIRTQWTGRPLEGLEMKIADPETGAPLPPHTVGEIQYRGYSLFSGYYKEPELTAVAIDAEGWFHSGDLGMIDENGQMKFVSRLKDMLKVGGENVAAAEIEDFLQQHPDVLNAQVVSAPDARYMEVPCAYLIMKPGSTATEAEIIDSCKGQISTFKIPRYVRFVTEYPMSGTKVKKFELRTMIAAELKSAGITEAPKITLS